ncbi:MAG: FdhF/YdeP family oxidoreductase [Nitrospinae bacterium]|nr:FdhF/YdeP family oxidoreductase [Nitrospinota bacterium]
MKVKTPRSAGGWGAILFSLKWAHRSGGLLPMLRALASKNSCKSCALGMGGQQGGMRNEKGSFPEVCNKSFLAQASDMQEALPANFFKIHDISTLSQWSPLQLELSGRLTQPVLCEPDNTHYRSISWDEAIDRIVAKIKATLPDRTFFYSSGRSSNEAGFLLQLLARSFGTNNVNNCSFYCHQASGVGMSQSLGTGTATVQLEDLDATDFIFLIGANPASNHPRFMRTLMEIRRRGGKVVVINPAREPGLENFSVPSDIKSLLFGSEIASDYVQPHIGGDIGLLKGIGKALLEFSEKDTGVLYPEFIENHTNNFSAYKKDLEATSWEHLEASSGVKRDTMHDLARKYSRAKNVVFAWAMGITHHSHGVENVHSIVNLALLRGMVGRKNAGLLPLRGHSNVQGIGSIGFTPQLKQEIFNKLESSYGLSLPSQKGLDTLACMEASHQGKFDFAWNLGGNLFGSNPDSRFTTTALSKIDFVLYMNTTLNQGHILGRGKTTLILPVLARDEEPQPTTQESMFSYIRMSDGGKPRHIGPRSEVSVIAEIAEKLLPPQPIPWKELREHENIRKMIGSIVPGFEKMLTIDESKKEFHIDGRTLHSQQFPTANGKAKFQVCPLPDISNGTSAKNNFTLMTVRSEGQFNTVVYELQDRYRGIRSRDVVLMNPEDILSGGFREGQKVTVKNDTGELAGLKIHPFPIRSGNILMYYPEANVLVPRNHDTQSKTPSFKSINVVLMSEE